MLDKFSADIWAPQNDISNNIRKLETLAYIYKRSKEILPPTFVYDNLSCVRCLTVILGYMLLLMLQFSEVYTELVSILFFTLFFK